MSQRVTLWIRYAEELDDLTRRLARTREEMVKIHSRMTASEKEELRREINRRQRIEAGIKTGGSWD